jgi:hypothetical protein
MPTNTRKAYLVLTGREQPTSTSSPTSEVFLLFANFDLHNVYVRQDRDLFRSRQRLADKMKVGRSEPSRRSQHSPHADRSRHAPRYTFQAD